MRPWPGHRETVNVTYEDNDTNLTEWLIQKGYLTEIWREKKPKYFIEVKTTTLECNTEFYMSHRQYLPVCTTLRCK
jgi:hypothetical protein